MAEQKAVNEELVKKESDKNQAIFTLQEQILILKEENNEMAQAFNELSKNQKNSTPSQ